MIFTVYVTDERGDVWPEEYNENVPDPHQWALDCIKKFNDTLRPGELARTVVKVEVQNTGITNFQHDWEKSNLVTEYYKGMMCDRYRCVKCGVTGRTFSLEGSVARAPDFKADKYLTCEWVQTVKKTINHKLPTRLTTIDTKLVEHK